MDHSDSGSNCSMDTSEISLECDHMEETDSWENDRELESNVWQKLQEAFSVLYVRICIPYVEQEALFNIFVTVNSIPIIFVPVDHNTVTAGMCDLECVATIVLW